MLSTKFVTLWAEHKTYKGESPRQGPVSLDPTVSVRVQMTNKEINEQDFCERGKYSEGTL